MSDLLKTTRGGYARTMEACFRAGHALGAAYMYGVLGGKAVSVSDPEFVALMQQLANGGIDASGNAWEAWSDRNDSALMEPRLSGVRAGLEAAKRQCQQVRDNADEANERKARIGADACLLMLCALSAESIAKEAADAAE